ncbi:hypothetical protein FH021_01575 [Listeria monocytogenes]|nr:hypothetical protein [Listeria monocytogenes]EBF5153227.1 hypothetical protein [Listeria monocytogenes]EBF5172152.1 hypothetical protein [Listeria monocytogenes]EBF5193395.1 hypothetical protein [Listeria monocytogenes]ECP9717655.1 hypothetical protein [Listeria monocytogenes]
MANLKELFPEFYQTNLNESDLSGQNGNLIVFDTNYLLDIIQMPTTVSKKYIEALEKVKDNIYIPYLVALEFNFKKSSIKKDKIKKIKNYKDLVEQSVASLSDNIKNIDLVDTKELEEFTKEILELTKIYSKNLTNLIEQKIESIITKEEAGLYEKLLQIIESKIGDKYEQEWITQVEAEGEERYEQQIPPGFTDTSKENEKDSIRRYGDIKYQRKYGDLIIWKDIIEHSKKCDMVGKKVIFITNDGKSKNKTDLLYKVNGMIVGPHIYLMNELQIQSKKELHILNNLRFVQLVNNLSEVEMNKLKTSSDQLYKVKIPYNQIERELKFIEEWNSKNSDLDWELGIGNDGYLFKKEKINKDRNLIEKEAFLQQLHDSHVYEQNKEEIIDDILIKKFVKSKNPLEKKQYLDYIDKLRYDEDKYLDENID